MYRTQAPLSVEELEAALRPFGQSRMLPRAAYVDEAVLEWERRHFFDSGWVCAGRLDDLIEPAAQKAVRVGTTGVLLTRDRARRAACVRKHLPPPRARAPGLRKQCRAGGHPVPVPRLEL